MWQDNQIKLDHIASCENLSDSAQCSSKTASFSKCHEAEHGNPTSPLGRKNSSPSHSSDTSYLSENLDINDNKCVLPCQDKLSPELSSDSSDSLRTVIPAVPAVDHANEDVYPKCICKTFCNFPDPHRIPTSVPLYVDTTLANLKFDEHVSSNRLLNQYSLVPGYTMYRSINNDGVEPTLPKENLALNWRRPVDEYLQYHFRMNSPLCVTVDSVPANAQSTQSLEGTVDEHTESLAPTSELENSQRPPTPLHFENQVQSGTELVSSSPNDIDSQSVECNDLLIQQTSQLDTKFEAQNSTSHYYNSSGTLQPVDQRDYQQQMSGEQEFVQNQQGILSENLNYTHYAYHNTLYQSDRATYFTYQNFAEQTNEPQPMYWVQQQSQPKLYYFSHSANSYYLMNPNPYQYWAQSSDQFGEPYHYPYVPLYP